MSTKNVTYTASTCYGLIYKHIYNIQSSHNKIIKHLTKLLSEIGSDIQQFYLVKEWIMKQYDNDKKVRYYGADDYLEGYLKYTKIWSMNSIYFDVLKSYGNTLKNKNIADAVTTVNLAAEDEVTADLETNKKKRKSSINSSNNVPIKKVTTTKFRKFT